jgi:hypothetical protein
MCGEALPRRGQHINEGCSPIYFHSLAGKAKPRRTSGGKAGKRSSFRAEPFLVQLAVLLVPVFGNPRRISFATALHRRWLQTVG